MSARDTAAASFRKRFGIDPEGVSFAPGRVNLIGEHVDYNDGLVLPMPVAQGTAVAWRRSGGDAVEVHAADLGEDDRFSLSRPERPEPVGWRSYCRGMVAHAPSRSGQGLQMSITGNLARGAGLSSSASLCIALGRAMSDAGETSDNPIVLARSAQKTEHEYAGVACGIMDQMAIAAGHPNQAMLLDCRNLAYRNVRLPDDWVVLTVASGVVRGLVDGEYNLRRAQCAEALRLLGAASFRDVTPAMVAVADLADPTARRARHVVSEIERVREAVLALESCDLPAFSRVLREGHASLRDDFEVSVPAVDRLVRELQDVLGSEGGARLTGAGFGGSVVVVASRSAALRVIDRFGSAVTPVHGIGSE